MLATMSCRVSVGPQWRSMLRGCVRGWIQGPVRLGARHTGSRTHMPTWVMITHKTEGASYDTEANNKANRCGAVAWVWMGMGFGETQLDHGNREADPHSQGSKNSHKDA